MSVVGGFKRRPAKNARSKRALKKYEPKVWENTKTSLYLQGSKTSDIVVDAMRGIMSLVKPNIKKLSKRSEIHPFENT